MTISNRTQPLTVSVLFAAEEVTLNLRDRRPDAIELFGELDEPARDQLTHDARAIGLRALANAHQAAQESKLKEVGTALLSDIDKFGPRTEVVTLSPNGDGHFDGPSPRRNEKRPAEPELEPTVFNNFVWSGTGIRTLDFDLGKA